MFSLQLGHTGRIHDLLLVTALIRDEIETPLLFEGVQAELSVLDSWAAQERLEITRLSLAGLTQARGDYGLLNCGAVLGSELGPYIIRDPQAPESDPALSTVIVDEHSTNFILPFFLYLGKYPKMIKPARESVVDEVAGGRAGFGLIALEDLDRAGRGGLEMAVDLGRWWAGETGLPLPLEVFGARRALGQETAQAVDAGLRRSFLLAGTDPATVAALIQEDHPGSGRKGEPLDPGPYLNRFSGDLGDEGREAVETMVKKAEEAGLIEPSALPLWAY